MDPNKLKTKCLRTMMVICIKQQLSNIWDKYSRVVQAKFVEDSL